ncbi:hypothetical protein VTH82DRAFT_1647 [Thermothelomyces myriococcoides]
MSEITLNPRSRLRKASDWFGWYDDFRGYAHLLRVWEYVDVDGTRELEHDELKIPTLELARERLLARAQKQSTMGPTPTPESSEAQTPADDTPTSQKEPTMEEIRKAYLLMKDEYVIRSQALNEAVNHIFQLEDWVVNTVSPKVYHAARARRRRDTNICRDIVRSLREILLGPTKTIREMNVAARYCNILEAAKRPGVNAERWMLDFWVAFGYAREADIAEIKGVQALYNFLDAIGTRIEPGWAAEKRVEIRLADGLGKPIPELEELVRAIDIFIINDSMRRGIARTCPKLAAAENGAEEKSERSRGRSRGCPCGKPRHYWEPVDCYTVKQALFGNESRCRASEKQLKRVRELLDKPKWARLKDQLTTKWGGPIRPEQCS